MSAESLAGVGQIATIMITDGGPHPPDKWADVTTQQIADLIVIEPSAQLRAASEKREFETALFNLLISLHDFVQQHERNSLDRNGEPHLLTPVVVHGHADDAAHRVVGLAQRFPLFAEHFSKRETRVAVYVILGQHFTDSAHIERRWYADRINSSEKS